MSQWTTIADLATAGATLVLAAATFSSVRSGNRTARAAERSLQVGLRPVLMPSRFEDPPEKVSFIDDRWLRVEGGHAAVELGEGAIYLAMGLRNAGQGIAVLHGWTLSPGRLTGDVPHAPPADFRRLTRDIYVPAGDSGFWQGAFRDPDDPAFEPARKALDAGGTVTIDLLYGDHEGGQRTVTRFSVTSVPERGWLAAASRHWNLDRSDPR